MDALFHGLSVVTVSWLVACPQALVHGGLWALGTASRPPSPDRDLRQPTHRTCGWG